MKYFAYSQREFVYKYVVMLSDVDQFQHMSFANYLKLMFLASDALFLELSTRSFLAQYRLVSFESKMQFKRQSVVGDQILIKINATHLEKGAFSLLYTFVVEKSGELIALGKQSFKLLESKSNVACRLPREFVQLIESIKVDEEYLLYKY